VRGAKIMQKVIIVKDMTIPYKVWTDIKHSPVYLPLAEEIEDRIALLEAKKEKGKRVPFRDYVKNRLNEQV